MVSGVQLVLRGRLRTPSAPQRGSLEGNGHGQCMSHVHFAHGAFSLCELPGEDAGGVGVAGYNLTHVGLVGCLDSGLAVELW